MLIFQISKQQREQLFLPVLPLLSQWQFAFSSLLFPSPLFLLLRPVLSWSCPRSRPYVSPSGSYTYSPYTGTHLASLTLSLTSSLVHPHSGPALPSSSACSTTATATS